MIRFLLTTLVALFVISAHAADHPAMVGWSLQNIETSDFRLQSGKGNVQQQYGAFVFQVPPNQETSWLLTTTPIWLDWFPQTNSTYRVDSQDANCSVDLKLLQSPNANLISLADPNSVHFTPGSKTGETLQEQHMLRTYQHLPVEQIRISIKSGNSPLTFTLNDLSLRNPDIGNAPIIKEFHFQAPDETTPPPNWNYLALPPSPNKLGDITPSATDAPLELRGYSTSGKLFELASDRRIIATSLARGEDVPINVNASGSDLFLLMSAHLIGKELHQGFSERTEIRSPDWFVVEKRYQDGAVERSLPFSLASFKYEIANNQWAIYHVPVNPDKALLQIVIHDAMPFGQMYLAAATLNPGPSSVGGILKSAPIQTLPIASTVSASSPQVSMNSQKQLNISNDYFQITFETQDAFSISSLKYVPENREMLQNPTPLFSLISNGLRVPDADWRVAHYEVDDATITLTLSNADPALPLIAKLLMKPTRRDACEMRLRIENIGAAPASLRVLFPALQSLSIHNDASEDIHFVPTERISWDRGEVQIDVPHSGQMPQQWMDLYSGEHQCGISIQTRDVLLVPKKFRLKKTTAGSRLGVEYGLENIDQGIEKPFILQGGEAFESPLTRIQIHGGDWRTPFASHSEWLKELDAERQNKNPLSDVFLIWRDYPYLGSGLIYNKAMNAYQFTPLLNELKREFGGVDLLELAGWMKERSNVASFQQNISTHDPDKIEIGSDINLRRNIEEAKSQNVITSLEVDPFQTISNFNLSDYRTNGYTMDDMTQEHTLGLRMNLNFTPWREYAVRTYTQSMKSLSSNALYYDRVGLGSPEMLPGEHALLRGTYQAFDHSPIRALYSERAPSDASTPYLDGALSYALVGGRYATQIPLNILRFAQPRLRIIEKIHPSIEAHLIEPERAKLCVFQGEGMWLKGRPRSWYSKEFRHFIKAIYPILQKHKDAFASRDVEPLLPTLQAGVYANRFSTQGKRVITLYNNNYDTVSGRLFAFAASNANALCDWGLVDFSVAATDDGVEVSGSLHPKDVAIIVIEPTNPDRERETK